MRFPLIGLPLMAACAWLATPAFAQGNVTLYGMIDAGVELNNSGKGTNTRMISGGTGGSRIGFRGNESLTQDLSAFFTLESGVLATTGAHTQGGKGYGRGSSVGISSKRFGSLSMGLINLPYFQVQSKVDAFDWRASGGLLSAVRDDTSAVVRVLPIATVSRVSHAISYVSPSFSGFQVRLLGSLPAPAGEYGHTYSGSVRYTGNNLDVMAGHALVQSTGNANGELKASVIGGSYKWSAVKLFLGHTREQNSCRTCTGSFKPSGNLIQGGGNDFSVSNIGVQVPRGNLLLIAQYARINDRSDYVGSPGKRASNWLALGMEYKLSKRTLVYGSVASMSNKNGSNFTLGSGTSTQRAGITGGNDKRSSTAVLGIRHTF